MKKKQQDKKQQEKLVITAALPYANGDIHIGHLLEYIQTDIYVRFLKLLGKNALYICASDMHGTPVEVNARKTGKEPEEFALQFWKEHQKDFASYFIRFDNYYKTHSPENKELAEYFFAGLKKKKLIYKKKIEVIYCNNCQRSLPDRYVRGTCRLCGEADQYGDVCEKCGSALKGTDLLNPKCSICSKTPVIKESEHYFFKLSSFASKLKKWINAENAKESGLQSEVGLQPEVKNWLKEWLDKGLEDWCISRDEPYFGFEIPGSRKECGESKYFYVWLDAPIGYISSTKNYCDRNCNMTKKCGKTQKGDKTKKCKWEDYWKKGKVQHFIGKDISYFHFLFWPAMLMAMEIPLPTLTVHGFITVNGEKMSKSRGTFFTAKDFLKLYPAESLRFYYASHLDRRVVDIDINFEDFKAVINNVLVGNLGNFCYRVLTFAHVNYDGFGKIKPVSKNAAKENAEEKTKEKTEKNAEEKAITEKVRALIEKIKENYQQQDFKSAVKNILQIADLGNAYFQKSEVWKNKEAEQSKKVVSYCVNLARNLAIVVNPILPEFSRKVYGALESGALSEKEPDCDNSNRNNPSRNNPSWDNIGFAWRGKVNKVEFLAEKIEKMPAGNKFPLKLVVGQIKEVKDHPNADNLYVMKVDFSAKTGQKAGSGLKQVVAGLKKYFSKDQLIGLKAVFCANLKLAKLRGEMSEAMVLAADDGTGVALLKASKTDVGAEVHFEGLENSSAEIAFEEFTKIKMEVVRGNVFFEKKKLVSHVEAVYVAGVKDGALVR